jgi:alcohol oxidase
MMYNRASASDYDDWNVEGWSFDDLKPLLKKVTPPATILTPAD